MHGWKDARHKGRRPDTRATHSDRTRTAVSDRRHAGDGGGSNRTRSADGARHGTARAAHKALRRDWRRCFQVTPWRGVKFCRSGTCQWEIGNRAKGTEGSTRGLGKRGKSSRAQAAGGRRANEFHYTPSLVGPSVRYRQATCRAVVRARPPQVGMLSTPYAPTRDLAGEAGGIRRRRRTLPLLLLSRLW